MTNNNNNSSLHKFLSAKNLMYKTIIQGAALLFNDKPMTLENQSRPQKKYNLMFIGTPDTADRIDAVKKRLVETLGEDIPVYIQDFKKFADGSRNVEIEESVGGKHVYVYADYFSDYMAKELLMDINSRYVLYDSICDAVIRNRAKTLNIITGKYPFARSDKNEDMGLSNKPKRVPLYASQVASHMSLNKVSNCISIDLHNPSVVGFFDGRDSRLTNLGYGWIIKKAIKIAADEHVVELGSTDLGGAKKVDRVASALKLNSFVGDKSRDRTIPNSVASVKIHKGSTKITESDIKVYDDMLDTGGTIEKVVGEIDNDSPHSTDIIVSHGLFNGRAWEVLNGLNAKGKLRTLYITDTVYRTLDYPSYVKVIPSAPIIAKTIESLVNDQSIDYNYDGE